MTANSISNVSSVSSAGTLPVSQAAETENADPRWKGFYRVGGILNLAQWILVLISFAVIIPAGPEPTTAAEYFNILQTDRLVGLLRMDFPTFIYIALFPISVFCLYAALKRKNEILAALATALVFTGVILALAPHSAFSMLHLNSRYAAATTEAQRAQLLAAGDAIIAGNMWNSSAGFLAGLFMQGGYVLFSLLMLRTKLFSKATSYTGLFANGLDWLHVFANLIAPVAGQVLLSVGGLFYLVWFPLLARDLLKLWRRA